MSHFQPVALHHANRLINHGPTVLVTSAAGGRRNVMAAAWSMPVEFTPPRIAVVIDKKTFTRELATASGAFGICLPGAALADFTCAVGTDVVAAAADARIFANGRWDVREDNAALHTLHHLGAGRFLRAGMVLAAGAA